MGKKQVNQMNIFDYIIGITIGSVVADISLDLEKDFVIGIVSILIFALSSYLVTYFSLKNLSFRKLVCGKPTILIEKGKILFDHLKKEGIDINSLQEDARLSGYFDLSKIDYAILETNGQISFWVKAEEDYVTNNDMKIKVKENVFGINLIQDGIVMEENLGYLDKDSKWLDRILKKYGYDSFKEVLLLIYYGDNNIVIYGYN